MFEKFKISLANPSKPGKCLCVSGVLFYLKFAAL